MRSLRKKRESIAYFLKFFAVFFLLLLLTLNLVRAFYFLRLASTIGSSPAEGTLLSLGRIFSIIPSFIQILTSALGIFSIWMLKRIKNRSIQELLVIFYIAFESLHCAFSIIYGICIIVVGYSFTIQHETMFSMITPFLFTIGFDVVLSWVGIILVVFAAVSSLADKREEDFAPIRQQDDGGIDSSVLVGDEKQQAASSNVGVVPDNEPPSGSSEDDEDLEDARSPLTASSSSNRRTAPLQLSSSSSSSNTVPSSNVATSIIGGGGGGVINTSMA